MVTHCYKELEDSLNLNESIYGSHTISASTDGWLIDEPGFYKVQAAIDIGDEVVISNVLRLYVAPPTSAEETTLALDYFTEDVAQALVFDGAPGLPGAMKTLEEVAMRCGRNPAALHATKALMMPQMRDYKLLEAGADQVSLVIRSTRADVGASAKAKIALMTDPNKAAETFGHIGYFGALGYLAEVMIKTGNEKEAKVVMQATVATMKNRNILASVVQAVERKLSCIK
jgi:hypothetical protein